MEHFAFSQIGLNPEVLEKEEATWITAIEKTEEVLQEIDHALVADIIGELYRKCLPGLPESELEKILQYVKIPQYEVRYVALSQGRKEEEVYEPIGVTNGVKMIFSAKEHFTQGKVNIPYLIHTFIHESLHVVATERSSYTNGDRFTTGISISRNSGIVNAKDNEALFYNDINEGLTDMLTDAVTTEYLTRLGEMSQHKEIIYQDLPKTPLIDRFVSYTDERLFVSKLIKEIQKVSNVSYDTIVQALVKEYFSNGNLGREEIQEAFKEYPQVLFMLETFKRNLPLTVPENEKEDYEYEKNDYENELILEESLFIKALFGRDVIGEYNKKVVNSL